MSPRGRQGEREGGEGTASKERKTPPLMSQSFFFFLDLYRIHLHHSFASLLLPKVGLFSSQHVTPSPGFFFFKFQGDENVPAIVGSCERKTPTCREKLDK